MAIDMVDIKAKQQKVWSSGEYGRIAHQLNSMADLLCEAVHVLPHHRVLDIATGTGNTAIAAANRNNTTVTGIDFAPNLIEVSRARAMATGQEIQFDVGDAEDLPYQDDSFDIVLSTVGVMFTPNQEQAASEMVRVCRPGGRIGLANWTPEGFVGQLLKTVGSFAPPPPGIKSPILWGTESRLHELLGDHVDLTIEQCTFPIRYLSPAHFADTFINYYGPTVAAISRIDESERPKLRNAMIELAERFGHAAEGSIEIPSAYLRVIGTVR